MVLVSSKKKVKKGYVKNKNQQLPLRTGLKVFSGGLPILQRDPKTHP